MRRQSEWEALRTVRFIVSGFFVFLLLLFTTQRSDQAAVRRISLTFIAAWFLVVVGNMWYGVTRAGYGVAEELPIAFLIILPPAVPAAVVWAKNRAA